MGTEFFGTNVKDFSHIIVDGGTLNVTANNGLDIKQQTEANNIIDSIRTGGTTNITLNNGQGNIDGNIASVGGFYITNNGTGNTFIMGAITSKAGNIEITNTGTSDIFQFGGLKAAGSIDVFSVDRDEVNALVPNAQRNDYSVLNHNFKAISKFQNEYDRLAFYGYDFKANDVVLSINDYADRNRSVSIDTLYANNAYINTAAQNLKVEDGIISNYTEFRNGFGYSVAVDNDYRCLVPATVQLYTALTGSFRLSMSNLIKTYTSAPVVHYQ